MPASTPANELKSVHKFVIQNGKTRVTSQVNSQVQDPLNRIRFYHHFTINVEKVLSLLNSFKQFS